MPFQRFYECLRLELEMLPTTFLRMIFEELKMLLGELKMLLTL